VKSTDQLGYADGCTGCIDEAHPGALVLSEYVCPKLFMLVTHYEITISVAEPRTRLGIDGIGSKPIVNSKGA
jgi:hypothetical protein